MKFERKIITEDEIKSEIECRNSSEIDSKSKYIDCGETETVKKQSSLGRTGQDRIG